MITIVIANFVSSAAHVPPPDATSAMMTTIMSNKQSLILFRSLLFSLVPLIAASTLVRSQSKQLSRQSLRAPFYAQCYLAAVCAAIVTLGDVFIRRTDLHDSIGWTVIGGGTLWFLAVQSVWFARKLNIGRFKAARLAALSTARAFVYLFLVVAP